MDNPPTAVSFFFIGAPRPFLGAVTSSARLALIPLGHVRSRRWLP
jgi:hypothetical protein